MKALLFITLFFSNLAWAQLSEDEIFDGCGTTYRCPNFTKAANYTKSERKEVDGVDTYFPALSGMCSSFAQWGNIEASQDKGAITSCNRLCTNYEVQCPFGDQTDPKMWVIFKFNEMAFDGKKSVCKCNRMKLFKDKTGTIISDASLDKIAGEITTLTGGKTANTENEKYDKADEFEYKKHVCKEFVGKRVATNYNFLRDSEKFTTENVYKNLSVFNVLLQMAMSGKFPTDTCIDYKASAPATGADDHDLKLSFAFKGAYLSGKALDHLKEAEKIGFMLNKFSNYRLINQKISYPKTINIHGFADQQFFAPRKEMTYYNEKEEEKKKYYVGASASDTSTGATDGLYDSVLESKGLADYPVIEELTKLEDLLKNKHMVFPFGETTSEKLKASYENYMSDVEVNELLALNRAVQTKRALKKEMSDFKFDYMEVGKNATSSCKNMISREVNYVSTDKDFPSLTKMTSAECAARRATVIEADVKAYATMTAAIAGGGVIEGITYKPGAYYYANCAIGNGDKKFIYGTFSYLLNGSAANTAFTDLAKPHSTDVEGLHGYNASSHKRLTQGTYSIIDVLAETSPKAINLKTVMADIMKEINTYSNDNTLTGIKYPLKIENIAKILSLPVFRFFTYPQEGVNVTGPWKFELNPKFKNAQGKMEALSNNNGFFVHLATVNTKNFGYFRTTRMYLDKGCAFTKEYRASVKENRAVSYAAVLALIQNEPLKPTGSIYSVTSKTDCIVLPNNLMFTNNCRMTYSPPSKNVLADAQEATNIFPFLGFDGTTAKEIGFEGDSLEGLVKELKAGTVTEAITKVNNLLCKTKGVTYSKPTVDEQKDCK